MIEDEMQQRIRAAVRALADEFTVPLHQELS